MHEMSVNSCFHQTNEKKHGQFVSAELTKSVVKFNP